MFVTLLIVPRPQFFQIAPVGLWQARPSLSHVVGQSGLLRDEVEACYNNGADNEMKDTKKTPEEDCLSSFFLVGRFIVAIERPEGNKVHFGITSGEQCSTVTFHVLSEKQSSSSNVNRI